MPARIRHRQSIIARGVRRDAVLGMLDPDVADAVRETADLFDVYPSFVVNECCAIVHGLKLERGSYADIKPRLKAARKRTLQRLVRQSGAA